MEGEEMKQIIESLVKIQVAYGSLNVDGISLNSTINKLKTKQVAMINSLERMCECETITGNIKCDACRVIEGLKE